MLRNETQGIWSLQIFLCCSSRFHVVGEFGNHLEVFELFASIWLRKGKINWGNVFNNSYLHLLPFFFFFTNYALVVTDEKPFLLIVVTYLWLFFLRWWYIVLWSCLNLSSVVVGFSSHKMSPFRIYFFVYYILLYRYPQQYLYYSLYFAIVQLLEAATVYLIIIRYTVAAAYNVHTPSW
jgi:hypothetical protein